MLTSLVAFDLAGNKYTKIGVYYFRNNMIKILGLFGLLRLLGLKLHFDHAAHLGGCLCGFLFTTIIKDKQHYHMMKEYQHWVRINFRDFRRKLKDQ